MGQPVAPAAVQMDLLDGVEGVPALLLTVSAGADGREMQAFVYQAHARAVAPGLEPFDWYLEFIRRCASPRPAAGLPRLAGRPDPPADRTRNGPGRPACNSDE